MTSGTCPCPASAEGHGERQLADGAAGEIPLKLLTQTNVPLLLVMDEIRLGLAPPALLKAGAMAAIALGMVAAPVAAAAAATGYAHHRLGSG